MIRALMRVYLLRLLFRRVGSCLLPAILVLVAVILLLIWAL